MSLELTEEWNEDVRALLLRNGWKCRAEIPGYLAELQHRSGRCIQIPLDPTFGDYFDIGIRTFSILATMFGVSPDDLLYESELTRCDVLALRHPASDRIGMPLNQAEIAVSSFVDCFQSAARSISHQLPEIKGVHKKAQLYSLLSTTAKLGHTKRGSFVFRIAVSIQRPLLSTHSTEPSSEFLPRRSTLGFTSGTRQAYEALTHPLTDTSGIVSAPFVDKLQAIASTAPHGDKVEISSAFSRWDPVGGDSSKVVTAEFSREDEVLLSVISERLRSNAHQFPDTLVGIVYKLVSLRNDSAPNVVSIRAQMPNGKLRTLNLVLTKEQYDLALEAHKSCSQVRVHVPGGIRASSIDYPVDFEISRESMF